MHNASHQCQQYKFRFKPNPNFLIFETLSKNSSSSPFPGLKMSAAPTTKEGEWERSVNIEKDLLRIFEQGLFHDCVLQVTSEKGGDSKVKILLKQKTNYKIGEK